MGRTVSLTPGVGNVCLLMSRFLQSVINFRDSWDTKIGRSAYLYYPQCLAEIDFWLRNCFKLNGKAFIRYSPPVVIIHSDASDFACGDPQEFELFFQAFSSIQTKQDSNSRELLAILYGLKSFRSFNQGKTVKVYTDNFNAHIIVHKG